MWWTPYPGTHEWWVLSIVLSSRDDTGYLALCHTFEICTLHLRVCIDCSLTTCDYDKLCTGGRLFSWGSNAYGQLGLRASVHTLSSPQVLYGWLVCHLFFSCSLKKAKLFKLLWGWGVGKGRRDRDRCSEIHVAIPPSDYSQTFVV